MNNGQPPAPDGVEMCGNADDEVEGPGAVATNPAADNTGTLPDEVLEVVFDFCGARTLMMMIPSVTKRWLGEQT